MYQILIAQKRIFEDNYLAIAIIARGLRVDLDRKRVVGVLDRKRRGTFNLLIVSTENR